MKLVRKLYWVCTLLKHMVMGYGIPKEMGIIYLSGPMSGYDDYNYPSFASAAHNLRLAGRLVIDPSESFGGNKTLPRTTYLHLDTFLLTMSSEIVLLQNWQRSRGSQYELNIAKEIGLKISNYESLWIEKYEDL